MHPHPVITLTTDFGTDDIYAGVMKGVILTINPACKVVDITHGIAPQDVTAGALALESAFSYFPGGSIHVAVVDPGVGSARRALVVEASGHFFVGPDNGIFSFALASRGLQAVYELTRRDYFLPEPSATFHGRDIFAPAAAHLSKGVPPAEMGHPVDDPVTLSLPEPVMNADGSLEGTVLHTDRFGNLLTNVRREMLQGFVEQGRLQAELQGRCITKLLSSYAAAQGDEPICIVGSSGRLEVSVKNGSAAALLGARRGDSIILRRLKGS